MKTIKMHKKELMKDPDFRREYKALEPSFEFAKMIIKKRIEKGLTQAELAKKLGTTQSAIARLESGEYNPSLKFLSRVADAFESELEIAIK
jgi:predicted transcriptional regulator